MHPEQYLILLTFLWVGFVSAISFMEAWLKFRAPGVTLPVGLSIGRLIFGALNKVEWSFALVCLILFFTGTGFNANISYLFIVPVLLLLLQSLWLLPAMNKRAARIIAGEELPPSRLHFFYIGAELLKVGFLVSLGLKLLQYK